MSSLLELLGLSTNSHTDSPLLLLLIVTRLAQKYDKVEYRGDWHAQKLRADIIGTPALDVDVAFYEKA